ncbi:hypothetical protein GCM10027275_50410 [Rhabdobacter roseus]|uniref:Uncharacterized protein n=1 Tax=Rhabdobacter roseus TaxID=1655419 RepID=A0A840TV40_9BACT|nr:hypothetical protein [Rhabdobacter roseus]MBB5287114.1 hypothetical protein [Rhabdobacter roseus]
MIRINGYEVLTLPGQRVEYTLTNPYLVYSQILGSQAQLPDLPAVRQNRAIFQYYEEPQAGGYLPELLFQHFYGGELIREGFYVLTEASEAGYKGTYTDKLGLFFGDYQQSLLSEIPLGVLDPELPLPADGLLMVDGQAAACLPTLVNDTFYGANGAALGYSGRINDYQEGAYEDGPKVPCVFVTWLLKRIAAVTGTTVGGSFFSHPQWSQLVLVNMREWESGPIDVRNHLPAWTIPQLLLELRKVPNLALTFNAVTRHLDVDFWEDSLRQPTRRDWSAKAVRGEVKTPEPNTRVQLSQVVDSGDALAKDKPPVLSDYLSEETEGTRNGIAQLPMQLSTMVVDEATGLAACRQEGQSSQLAQQAKAWAPRLLFWQGVVAGYPRALPTLGGLSLYPQDLATTSWRETIALRKRMFYLQKDFVLTETDLARLDFREKIHVDGVDYLIAQLNVAVPIEGVATALLIGGV